MNVNLYPEMNQKIVQILRISNEPSCQYAAALIESLQAQLNRYKDWVNDLQSGMYVNCVYCGHRYGPEDKVSVSMADALKEHIENCPEHPMSALKAQLAKEKRRAEKAVKVLERIKRDINEQDKIYIHIADYFGRGIYIDEEEGDAE